jgi:hypothetical protein
MITRLPTFLCAPTRRYLSARNYFTILIAVSLALASTYRPAIAAESTENCTSSNGKWAEQRPSSCLQDPGWFDVGAGISIIKKAGIAQQNGVGNMVTLRAYPFGRWYAPLKSQTPASTSVVEAKLIVAKTAADQAKASGTTTDQAVADKANADVAQSMQAALNDFGNNYALEELNGMQNFSRRISFFLGRSIGGFDSKAVDGDINAFGIAIDISPEFSVVWGRAYFNQPAQTGVANSSKSGAVIGVQINLKAFKAMRGLTGSL